MSKNRFTYILCLFLSLSMALQGTAMAETVVTFSLPVVIVARITTHPDYYNTGLPLQMVSPVVSDLDADGVLEIIGAGYNTTTQRSSVFVWNRNGRVNPGWPIEIDGRIENIPAVGDLDGDGDLEIVVNVTKNPPDIGGWVYIWHYDASPYAAPFLETGYTPGAPLAGDISGGFAEEVYYNPSNVGMALCDVDMDGKKELITAGPAGLGIFERVNDDDELVLMPGGAIELAGAISVGVPIAGDVDGDGTPEMFLAVSRPDGNYIYGWHNDMTEIEGWPVNIAGVVNTPGNFLSLADINGDGIAEILTGSINGWIAGWNLDGSVRFSQRPVELAIYQPIVGDIDNDGDMEILANSGNRAIYCYDHNGDPVGGWPRSFSYELSQGAVLVDIDNDAFGDSVNPANDLELLYGGSNGRIHILELSGNFNPNNLQWGMSGFNPRNSGNYLRDWDTSGWFVFDGDPEGASIESVYDWNRGNRVIELRGAGLDNSYVFRRPDARPFNSKNTTIQWSMSYGLDFHIYVSVDTLLGRRYLYYTATDGDSLLDESGRFIHHGLGGDADNARWHTFSRSLVTDLKDAEPANEIVDVNAFYVQGSGRIDDVMLLPGLPAVDLVNLAFSAEVEVSSGDATKGFINDGDADTVWTSGDEDISWVEYTWDEPQRMNKVVVDAVEGATSGVIFITDSSGNVYEIEFTIPPDGGPIEVVFDSIDDVVSIIVVFDNEDGPVSVGEIEVYYDPNVEEDGALPEEEYTADRYIQTRDGYFFNPVTGNSWIPRGIAYQTWNAALGQWQTPSELRSDLDIMQGIGVDTLRVDFVWRHIETVDGVYDWSRYDLLLEESQARGMKVFPLIGYQWPPSWFPEEWYTMHPQNEAHPDGPWLSDIISYEDPDVQTQFRDFLQAVVRRYSVSGEREDLGDTVAGWILGNEYGYLGLVSMEYDGYDPDSQRAFREWLEERYGGDIGALNARWAQDNIRSPGYLPNYPYENFDEVDMPIPFGYGGDTSGVYLCRDKASWYDRTQWCEESIAGFVALSARAVRDMDPDHLITYSAVGMQWGEEDWRYHTEDAKKIKEACDEIEAPLSFWSINNYPWGLENNELITGQWGIEKAKHDTRLPIMITETGFTNTETIYPGIDEERQARLVRNAIWEALENGVIGVCVFHWNDRDHPWLSTRERGFGIVRVDREPKPSYFSVRDVYAKMDEIDIAQYLVGSTDPVPDVAFLWDDATDTIINRYKAEMKELYGTLERLGYEPSFIDDEELAEGLYMNYDAIILPRNQKMLDETFDLLDNIRAEGVKIHADSDIPGVMNEYGELRDIEYWQFVMRDLFGIDVSGFELDLNLEDDITPSGYETGSFTLEYRPKTLYYPGIGFTKTIDMWKYRDVVEVDGGVGIATFDSEDGTPSLVFHNGTAISLFSLGDNEEWTWSDKYDWMRAIYTEPTGFGIPPQLVVSNKHILVDYRVTGDGSILLSFKNYRSDTDETTTVTTGLIAGRRVLDLLTDELIADPSDGTILMELEPDGHGLLLAYNVEEEGEDGEDGDDEGEDGDDEDGDDGDDEGEDGGEGDSSSTTSGGSTDTSSSSGSSGSGSSSSTGSTDTVSSTNTSSGGSVVSAASTGINSSKRKSGSSTSTVASTPTSTIQEEDSDSPRSIINGPTTIVIYEEDKDKENKKITGTAASNVPGSLARQSSKRTYVGSGYHTGSTSSTTAETIPPLEQFQMAIEDTRDREVGIIRANPEIVAPNRLEEMIRRAPVVTADVPQTTFNKPVPAYDVTSVVNKWISNLKDLWKNLVKKIQLAYKTIPRRYV